MLPYNTDNLVPVVQSGLRTSGGVVTPPALRRLTPSFTTVADLLIGTCARTRVRSWTT
jgi:hypothetical protein